jgi:hypothetical protein
VAARDVFVARRSTAGGGAILERSSTPVEERLTVRLHADGARRLETTLRLLHGVRRLELEYRLWKEAADGKESVYFTFPFAEAGPELLVELTAGVAASSDRVPGSAAHVQAVRHWAALRHARGAVALATLDTPLFELGTIFLPYPPYPPTAAERPGTLVAWAMNNVWDTNFVPSQPGEARFAFAVASADDEPRRVGGAAAAALTRPLVAVLGAARGETVLRGASGSFCAVDHPEVELVTLAQSRRGHAFVALLHSLAEEEVEVRVEFLALGVERIWCGTFLERDLVDVTDGRGASLRLAPGAYVAVAVDVDE